ncbi:MAG: hypothetical protein AAB482_02880 [Patescibacteria group bacterium]
MLLQTIDNTLISFFRKIVMPFSRFSLFVIFFWFGFLKVIGLSPASELVEHLFNQTIPFMSFGVFLITFGLYECLIGILFLVRGAERVVMALLFVHMITTCGPLFFLPQETWSGFLVPTLEGQYIIKNLVIIATAMGIFSNLEPIKRKA